MNGLGHKLCPIQKYPQKEKNCKHEKEKCRNYSKEEKEDHSFELFQPAYMVAYIDAQGISGTQVGVFTKFDRGNQGLIAT